MEELMYFVWQQRLTLPTTTLDGQPIEVIHPGLRNLDAGPDFFNAKLRIGGVMWAGNVEMHVRASDWFRHHHHQDRTYDSVILHVVLEADADIMLPDGNRLKTVVIQIPDDILDRYCELCGGSSPSPLLPGQSPTYHSISCARMIEQVPHIIREDWVTALAIKRMSDKSQRLLDLVEKQLSGWPDAFYVVLLRSLGTGVNSDNMERLARSLPYSCLLHHRDNLLQLTALLLGQSGLLSKPAATLPQEQQSEWLLMQREYAFLSQKFSLKPMPGNVWKTGRIRPPAQPEYRLRVFARLIHHHHDLYSKVFEAQNLQQLIALFADQGLGMQTIRSLIINAVVPAMLAYARWQSDDDGVERAMLLLEQLPPEENRYITLWKEVGFEVRSAYQTQALLHLHQNYCQPHKCLHCRIGNWLLSQRSLLMR